MKRLSMQVGKTIFLNRTVSSFDIYSYIIIMVYSNRVFQIRKIFQVQRHLKSSIIKCEHNF